MVLVLLSASVAALGVTPGRTTLDYTSNSHHTVNFNIVNDQHKDMKLFLFVTGDLNKSIALSEQLIDMKAKDMTKEISYTVHLPASMKPGKSSTSITIMEIPNSPSPSDTQIGAVVGVVTQLVVNVPYPGKYLEIGELEVSESEIGGVTNFIIPVTNMGKEKLLNVKATIEILGPTNEFIASVDTENIKLEKGQRQLLKASWKADVNPGKYFAVATITYDRKTDTREKVFNVGTMDIEIEKVETKNFKLGGIAKIDITLKNNWNDIIKELYGELLIRDLEGDPVADIKTASVDLQPHARQDITAYWETAGLKEGKYEIILKLFFMGRTIEKHLETILSMNSMTTSFVSATGQVISSNENNNRNTLLSIAIIILIIMNISWFVYFKKKMKK